MTEPNDQERTDLSDEELDGDPIEDNRFGDDQDGDDQFEDVSLDELGAAYARAAAEHDPEAFAPPLDDANLESPDDQASSVEGPVFSKAGLPGGGLASPDSDPADMEEGHASPESIIEGALFVGHPENKPLTEERLATLMRDVEPQEVVEAIDSLNASYRDNGQALRIVREDFGFRMTISPEVESVRRSFLGKVRETRLSQLAIEVLSLVAYQPGITAQKVQDQRGRESHSLLNQLVRRQLLEMRRIKPEGGGRAIPHYYPTERFLHLFGIESLEDLPQVEEGLREE
jgi:segregation and condensation protein B